MRRVLAGVTAVGGTLLVAGLAAISLNRSAIEVERTVTLDATPAVIFPLLDDLELRNRWDVWRPDDPQQYAASSDASSGVGAWIEWDGEHGDGEVAITASQLNQYVVQEVQIWEPVAHRSEIRVTLEPSGDQTLVTYKVERQHDFMGKMVGLLADVPVAIGKDVDLRLKRLEDEITFRAAKTADRSSRAKMLLERAARAAEEPPPEPPSEPSGQR